MLSGSEELPPLEQSPGKSAFGSSCRLLVVDLGSDLARCIVTGDEYVCLLKGAVPGMEKRGSLGAHCNAVRASFGDVE